MKVSPYIRIQWFHDELTRKTYPNAAVVYAYPCRPASYCRGAPRSVRMYVMSRCACVEPDWLRERLLRMAERVIGNNADT